MRAILERSHGFLGIPLEGGPRALLLLGVLLLVPLYLFPLWNISLRPADHPEGLRLSIYSYKLEAGRGGKDLLAINAVNRRIGMKELQPLGFSEFKWMPFVAGAIALLMLRSAALGTMATLVDVLVLYLYFGLFSLWSFAYKLYRYGHDLSATAPVRVPPFTAPLAGSARIADVTVSSAPGPASWALAAAGLLLLAALLLAWSQARREHAGDAAVAG